MLLREFEEHVPSGCHDHPEVSGATLLFGLNENAGCVGADVRLLESIEAHGVDERLEQRSQLRMPAADCGAVELYAVTRVDLFEAIERQVIVPTLDQRVSQHAWPSKTALDRKSRCARLQNGRCVTAIFQHELGLDDPNHDHGCGATLQDL